jgi:peptide chain release factor 2
LKRWRGRSNPSNTTFKNFGGTFDPEATRKRIQDLEAISLKPNFWNDRQEAQKVLREKRLLEKDLESLERMQAGLEGVMLNLELLKEENDASLQAETQTQIAQIQQSAEQMRIAFLFTEEEDQSEAVVEINAGAGGTESCDWASMLFRMYTLWASAHGFGVEVLEEMGGEGAGIKHVTFVIKGDRAYGMLKTEIGIHRLVRISPFDANKKRHTSFASVYAYPDVEDEIVIEINPADVKTDTYRAGGAGGQHVNKTDSAVRLTHMPTGTVVQCQSERSQHQNKERAWKLLRAKLYDLELKKRKEAEALAESQKSDISWGNQIRSYVLHPYRLVKDHRTKHESSDADRILDGDLDGFMVEVLKRWARPNARRSQDRKKGQE